ncbi:MAG TPA: NUDIX-like domain-containing protein, partial [Rhizomicrobium sp.]|nr:NUDIX-like domain-containing protein [Rhizomicrobium sp.]
MSPITFSGNPLERASAERPGEAWIAARRQAGLFLPFWQNRPFVAGDRGFSNGVLPRAGFRPWDTSWEGATTIFLGLDGAQPLFAVELAGET